MAATLDVLMEALDFTSEDLAANRAGKLSARQVGMFQPSSGVLNWLQLGCSAFGMVGFLTLCPATFAFQFWRSYWQQGAVWLLGVAAALTVLTFLGLALGLFGTQLEWQGTREMNTAMAADVAANQVLSAVVTITTDEVHEHYYASNTELDVMLYVENDVMQLGEQYRVYYTPTSNLLLSAEPLP
jgi:hypothetical protein